MADISICILHTLKLPSKTMTLHNQEAFVLVTNKLEEDPPSFHLASLIHLPLNQMI